MGDSGVFSHLFTHANLLTLSLWLGALTPNLAEVLKQDRFSKRINSILAFLVSVVVGMVTVAVKGDFTASNVIGTSIAIYVVASATYGSIWKPTGVMDAIGSVTQFVKAADPTPTPDAPVADPAPVENVPLDPTLLTPGASDAVPPDSAAAGPSGTPTPVKDPTLPSPHRPKKAPAKRAPKKKA